MSKINRKILYDKLMAEGKVAEAEHTIQNHPEMREAVKEEAPQEDETKSKKKK